MTQNKTILTLATFALAVSGAISSSARATQLNIAQFAASNNATGVKVYKEILAEQGLTKENTFFSPFSLHQALGLVLNAAGGESFLDLASMMGLKGIELPAFNGQNQKLLAQLEQGPAKIEETDHKEFTLQVANSVWGDNSFKIKDSYAKTVGQSAQAEVQNLDFQTESSADVINQWVSDKTQGKITSITEANVLRQQVALLINATYFKADWTNPFEAALTNKADFTNFAGDVVKTDTMTNDGRFRHLVRTDLEAIELPYGLEQKASMIVVVPSDYASFESSIDAESLEALSQEIFALEPTHGNLRMPKFKFEKTMNLVDPLSKSGMAALFGGVDLSGMSEETNLAISSAIQKSFVAVDEKGTEAAAVTAIGVTRTSVGPRRAFYMSVDRPFVFIIRDNTTGLVLFMGTVVTL